ncbi:hypothetical protein LTR95_001401 [Oleoguttula sp. CCFEE 5521]
MSIKPFKVARPVWVLALLILLATLTAALPALNQVSDLVIGNGETFHMARDGDKPSPPPMADDRIPPTAPDSHSVPILWGNQIPWGTAAADALKKIDGTAFLKQAHCFGGHGKETLGLGEDEQWARLMCSPGISNIFFDKAVETFCNNVNGKVLSLTAVNTSYAQTYTYWPPAMHGGKAHDDCGDSGSVYLHIGFGLGAPGEMNYTLSAEACTRGLKQVYNHDCDGSHTDNKRGGQLDLGTYVPQGQDDKYNDHLFYLADPNPPIVGRNKYCSNLERFVPNAEDTYTFDTYVDPCFQYHEGYGGDDFWFRDPPEWTDHKKGWDAHDANKTICTAAGGIYDKHDGVKDNNGNRKGQRRAELDRESTD